MSVDPGEIRAEAHCEIGFLIQRDVGVLIERWSRRAVEEQPNATRVHHEALIDHLHDLLRALGRSLAESDETATSQHCLPAVVHGEQRWETGWSLTEVVRDYGILRLVLLDYLEEMLDGPPPPRAVMAIGLALDEAIAASVTMYVNSRDNHQRQMEEQRAERDRQIHDELRQKATALAEADRRKNEFIAILGHELRNPFATLWYAVDLLETRTAADDYLAEIHQVARRQLEQLGRLSDDLLDISRIAQGKLELRKEPLDLASVVEQAAKASGPLMQARSHQFEVAVPREPLWVAADRARLAQIVGNLLSNAAKYTEHGGRVSLVVERAGGEAVIRVRDSGIGIPPQLLSSVFEMFAQGEWSAVSGQAGMGIGLALVRRLVELHGGSITAASAGFHQGSEFEVRFPLDAPADSAQPRRRDRPQADDRSALDRRRVLVVDDNEDVAKMLNLTLSAQGHCVQVAHDGPAAIQAAIEFRPDVVLLDLGLPQMDGHEVARRLRELPDMEDVSLVALTGYAQDENRRRCLESYFNLYLVKPITLEALKASLGRPAARSPRRK